MALIPPQPVGVLPGSGLWNDWIEKIRTIVNGLSTSISWALITGKPTTVAGFGITDAVTTSTTLDANRLILGNGSHDVVDMASLGTATTVLHGNAAGAPTFGSVVLTTDVSGILPIANGGTGVTTPTANPTASVGLSAVNGVANTYMRSDAAPALSQSIAPTWTGIHQYSANSSSLPATAVPVRIQVGGADSTSTGLQIDTFASSPVLAMRRSQGTAATPSALGSGQGFANIIGYGYGSTSYSSGGRATISFNANEAWTDTAQGSRINFNVTPNTTTTQTLVSTLSSTAFTILLDNQEIQIGAGTDLRLYHNGTDSYIENDTGNLVLKVNGELSIDEVSTTTVAPGAGGAGALPATPAGYVTVIINGVSRQLAYY